MPEWVRWFLHIQIRPDCDTDREADGFIRNGIMAFDAFSDVAYFRIIVHVFPYMIGYAVTGLNGLPGLSGRQCQSNTLNS